MAAFIAAAIGVVPGLVFFAHHSGQTASIFAPAELNVTLVPIHH